METKFSQAFDIHPELRSTTGDASRSAMAFEQTPIKLEDSHRLSGYSEDEGIRWCDSTAIATGDTDPFHADWAHW